LKVDARPVCAASTIVNGSHLARGEVCQEGTCHGH
jgi:hypothetical protein